MIVSLSVLVTIHEYGHFWVARRCGVKVLRFSIGFGRPLVRWHDKHGTEFVIALLPMGGYVKMLDERQEPVAEIERPFAFNNKSVWQRIAVVAAGPLSNIVLAWALLWATLVFGRDDYSATIGNVTGLAEQAHLQPGEVISRIDGNTIRSWSDAQLQLTGDAMDRKDAHITVRTPQNTTEHRVLALSQLARGFDEHQVVSLAGIQWKFTLSPTIVDGVMSASAADGSIYPNDQLLAINNHPITSPDDLLTRVQSIGKKNETARITLERNHQRIDVTVQPRPTKNGQWLLGLRLRPDVMPAYDTRIQLPVLQALPAAANLTLRLSSETIKMLWRIASGRASVHNISGPITSARIASISAARGVDWFLYFLALMSLSLAVINLLPIPILDGGHLLYYIIEVIARRPLDVRAQNAGQYIGLALLAGLMGLAFYNDIASLIWR